MEPENCSKEKEKRKMKKSKKNEKEKEEKKEKKKRKDRNMIENERTMEDKLKNVEKQRVLVKCSER